MKTYLKILHILSWIPIFAINIVLWIMGIFVVSWYARDPMDSWPKWTWIWQNDEDQGEPLWYVKKYPDRSPWLRRFLYMAFRNPVNNHRFIFEDKTTWYTDGDLDAFDTEGSDLVRRGIGMAAGWRWAGAFAGYRRIWLNSSIKYSEFYIGWKVGSSVPGLGFTFQLRLKRDFIRGL